MATDLMDAVTEQQLAILGGPKVITQHEKSLFHWPIVTEEDEQAVIAVLRDGSMSGVGITKQFEQEFAAWQGVKHALAYPNGTMALMTAMWALGVRRGDEIIAPSMTYWASATPVLGLGGIPVFADVDPKTLCLDPADIERHISKRTKLIVPVHYAGHPCDMDAIMAIAKKHNLKVLEDVSHSHGALYKGRMVGTFGHAAAMSMMAGKSFAIGEGGMLVTNDRAVYERAALFANYERHTEIVTDPELKPLIGIPWGGMKGRLNQTAAAMGRVQLKHYPARIREIQAGMNRFWDLLEGVPGLEVTGGVVKVAANMMTGHDGIFAGGDMVPAERNVTVGIGHGKQAARHIDAWLRGEKHVPAPQHEVANFEKLNPWYYADAPKTVRPMLDIIRRQSTFDEVQGGLDESNALFEARRCLSCGNCFECDNCYGVCPDNAVIKLGPGKRFEFNYDYCKGCGMCVAECPCGAIKMEAEEI